MQISKRTINILNNFATIQNSIKIDPGNLIYTSRNDAVMAWAEVDETFDREIRISNLPSFLSVLERFDGANVDFDDKLVVVSKGRYRMRFRYLHPHMYSFAPLPFTQNASLHSMGQKIGQISKEDLVNVKKMSSTINAEIMKLMCQKGIVVLRTTKDKDKESDRFDISIANGLKSPDFVYTIGLTRMVLPPDNYDIIIGEDKFVGFYARDLKVSYMFGVNAAV